LRQAIAEKGLCENTVLGVLDALDQQTPASERDWMLTSVWVFAMDALALGLVVMVLGSYYMWWHLKKKRTLGAFALAAGLATCGAFVAGIL